MHVRWILGSPVKPRRSRGFNKIGTKDRDGWQSLPLAKRLAPVTKVYAWGVNKGWVKLRLVVDSGAGETVMSEETLPGVRLQDSEDSRNNVRYEVADGTLISARGENILFSQQQKVKNAQRVHK